ncbi:DNA adenine methylase [Bernardetia sp. ABR2-2B]|uniref:DNA adenine methylase n=1 Tax=Bernardetia sp. ABR2-2B TaxID=3127472 RepID=UPI0030D1B98A
METTLQKAKVKRKVRIKTPISYYGGKQQMLKYILPLIPKHLCYTEAFSGGAAVFWAKEPAKIEAINDLNENIVTFWEVLKTDFDALNEKVQSTLHSNFSYKKANIIYNTSDYYSKLDRAWALWVLTSMSYGSMPGGGFAFQKRIKNACAIKVKNKRLNFIQELSDRLETTTIEHEDACKIIKRYDTRDSFHYVDPPYINSNQGHYDGYTEEHYKKLLSILEKVEGKFLLSSYPSEVLAEFAKRNNWQQIEVKRQMSMSKNRKVKTEVLTANYDIHKDYLHFSSNVIAVV